MAFRISKGRGIPQSRMRFPRALFIIAGLCIGFAAGHAWPEETEENTLFLNAGEGELRKEMMPEVEGEFPCLSCSEIWEMKVDDQSIAFDSLPLEDGTGELAGQFTGLEDGRHRACLKAVDQTGSAPDSKEVVFFVDTGPPVLEIVEPQGDTIPPTRTTFLVRFDDKGSGIPSIVDEMNVEAQAGNRAAFLNLSEKGGRRFFLVDAQGPGWEPGGSVDLYLRIEDRAGNRSIVRKAFQV